MDMEGGTLRARLASPLPGLPRTATDRPRGPVPAPRGTATTLRCARRLGPTTLPLALTGARGAVGAAAATPSSRLLVASAARDWDMTRRAAADMPAGSTPPSPNPVLPVPPRPAARGALRPPFGAPGPRTPEALRFARRPPGFVPGAPGRATPMRARREVRAAWLGSRAGLGLAPGWELALGRLLTLWLFPQQ
jgi:hypothetical protein